MASSYSGLYDRLFMPTENTLSSLRKLEELEQLRKKNLSNILSRSAPLRSNRLYRTYDSTSLPRRKDPVMNRRQNLHSSYQRTNSYDYADQSSHLRNTLTKPVYEPFSDRIGSFIRRGSDTTDITSSVSQYLGSSYIENEDYSSPSISRGSDYSRRRSRSLTDAVISGEQQVSLGDIYAEGEQERHAYPPRKAMTLTPASSTSSLTEDMPDFCEGMLDKQLGEEYMKTCADIQNLSNISDLPPLEGDDEFQTYISNVAPETDFELYEHQQIDNKANMFEPVNHLANDDLHTVDTNTLNTGQIPQPLSAPYYPSNIRQLTTNTNDLETVEEEIEGTFFPHDRACKADNNFASSAKIGARSPKETNALTIGEINCQLLTDLDASELECKLVADNDATDSKCQLVTDLDAPESECRLVTDLDAPESKCQLVTDLDAPESECRLATDLDAPESECKLVTDLDVLESECQLVTDLDAPELECRLVTDFDAPESECNLVTDLDAPESECNLVTYLDAPESECRLATDLDAPESECKLVTDLDVLESECQLVTDLDAPESECRLVTDLDAPESECNLVTYLDAPESECKLVTDLDAPESECKLVTDLDVPQSKPCNQQNNTEMQSRYVEITYSDANDNVYDQEEWVVIEDIGSPAGKKTILDGIKYINEASDQHIGIVVDANVDNESLDSLPDDDYKLAPEEKKKGNTEHIKSEVIVTADNVASESDTENYETASDTEDNLKDGQQTVSDIDTQLKDGETYQPITDTHWEQNNEQYHFPTDWEEAKMKENTRYSESEYDDTDLQRTPVYEIRDSKYRMQFSRRRPMNTSYSVDSSHPMNNSYSSNDPYIRSSPYQSERPFYGGVSTSNDPSHLQTNYSPMPIFVSSVGIGGTCTPNKADCCTQTDPELGSKSEISIQTEVRYLTSKGTQTPDKESTTFKDTLIERGLANSNRSLQGQLTEIRSTIKTVLETTPEEPQYLSVREKKQLFASKAESAKESPVTMKKELFPKNEINKPKKTEMTRTILFDLKNPLHNNKPERPSELDKTKSTLFSFGGNTEEYSIVDSIKMAEENNHDQPLSPDETKSLTGGAITQICQKLKQTEQKEETAIDALSPIDSVSLSVTVEKDTTEVYNDSTATNNDDEVLNIKSSISSDGIAEDDMPKMKEYEENGMEMYDKTKKTPPKPLKKPKSLKLDKVYWFDVSKEHGEDDGNDIKRSDMDKNMIKNPGHSVSCSSLNISSKKLNKMPKLILQSSDSILVPNKSDQDKTPVSDQQFTSIRENPFIRNDKTKLELKAVRSRNFHSPNVWQKFSWKHMVSPTVKEDDETLNKTNPFIEMLENVNTLVDSNTEMLPSEKNQINSDEYLKQSAISPEKLPKSKNKPVSRKGSFGKKNKKRQVSQVRKQTWNYEEKKSVSESEQIALSDTDSVLSRTPSVSGSLISVTSSTFDDSIESSSGIISASSPDISHPLLISSNFSSATNLMETDIDEAIRKAESPERIDLISSIVETEQGVDLLKKSEHLEFAETICDTLNLNKNEIKSHGSQDCLAETKKTHPPTKNRKSEKTIDEVSNTEIKQAPVRSDDGQIDVEKEDDVDANTRINLSNWDPCKVLEDLYKVQMMPDDTEDISHQFIAMEGLMEKLPINKKKATLLKTWKRRYFRATDGWLHYYESSNRDQPNESIQLMGGRLDELGNRILGIDDGRGRCLMVRVPTEREYGQWKLALESQTADNMKATYIQPVFQAKPHSNKRVVIIDIGSSGIRAGILGDKPSLPQLFFPSVVAINKASKQLVLGLDCFKPEIRQAFTISHPIRPTNKVDKERIRPFNIDMDVMPILFQKIFADLEIKPNQYLVMLSTPQNMGDKLKEGMMKIFVDKYHVMGVCMVQQALLALYSYNAMSGIIVDIGERMEILPIYDGMLIEGGVARQAYGGQKVRDSLNIALMENKYKFNSPVEKIIVRYIMEKSCYVVENYKEALSKLEKSPKSIEMTIPLDKYNLPANSHTSVSLGISRFKSPEGFFNTDLWGMDYPNIHKLVYQAIQACPIDSRKHMYRSIFLSGGVTMLPGFAERLQIQLQQMSPPSVIVEVHASPQRYHSAYIGACSLAGMDIFEQTCIMADDWKASGVQTFKKWNTAPS